MISSRKDILVSIVIPLFNKSNWIVQTLESVKAQSYKKWECIIIDDGSTDDSYAKVEEFIKNNPGFNWNLIKRSNSGQAATRNYGINQAKGIYIAFLDADDLWLPGKLETETNFLERNLRFDGVLSDYIIFNVNSNSKRLVRIRNSKVFLINWLNMSGFGALPESNGLWKTENLKSIGGFDSEFSTSSGLDLLLRYINKFEIGTTQKVCTLYRISSDQWHKLEDELQINMALLFKNYSNLQFNNLADFQTSYLTLNRLRKIDHRTFILVFSKNISNFNLKRIKYILILISKIIYRNIAADFRARIWFLKSLNKSEFNLAKKEKYNEIYE